MQHGSNEGGERLLGGADLAVTEGGLFEGRDGDLGEALEVLDGVKAEADGIADIEGLDDAVEELREDLVERWLRDLKKKNSSSCFFSSGLDFSSSWGFFSSSVGGFGIGERSSTSVLSLEPSAQ